MDLTMNWGGTDEPHGRAGSGDDGEVSPDEIATMLDELADAITREDAERYGQGTRPGLTGDQAITVIVMALRKMAERVSRQ
jgi:hypothetical protein